MDAKEAFFKAMGWTEDAKDLPGQMNLPGFEEPKTPKVTQPSLPGASKWKQKSPKAKVPGSTGDPLSELEKHDRESHKGGYKGGKCIYRAQMAAAGIDVGAIDKKRGLPAPKDGDYSKGEKQAQETETTTEEQKKNPEALESPEKVDVGGTDLEVKDQTQAAAADLLKEYLDDPKISEEKKEGAKAIIEKLQQTIKQNDAASSPEYQEAEKEEEAAKHEEAIEAGKEMGAEVASAEGQMDLLVKNHEQALAGLAQQIEALGGKEPETTALKNELDKENKKFAKEFQKLDPVEQSADGTQETPEDHAKHCKANPKSNCPFLKSAMSEEQLKQLDAHAATEEEPHAEAAAKGEEPPKEGEAEQEPHNSIEWDKDRYEREYKNSPEAEKIRDVFRKMLDEGVTEFDVEYNPYLMQLLNEVLAEKGATKVQYINEADLSEVDEIKTPLDTRPGIIGKKDWTPAQKAALEDLARRFGAAVEGITKGVDDTKFTRLLNDINRFKAVKSRWDVTPNVSAPRSVVREGISDLMDDHVDKTYSDSTVDVIEKLLAQDVLVNKAVSASIKGDLEYIQGILTDPQATTKEVRDANKMYRSLIEKYGLDEVLEGGKDSRAGETVQGYLEDGDENHRKGGVVSSNNEYPDWKINIENVADEKEGNGSVNNSDEIKEKIRNDLSKKNFPAEIDDIKETNYISTTDFTFKFPKDMKVTKSLIADLKQEIARNFPLAEDKNLSINYNDRTDTLTVTVENDNKGFVSQKRLLQSKEFQDAVKRGEIAIALGLDEKGNPVIGNLTDYIHVLLAGQTGSGKSARLGSILSSLMMQSPDNFKMILIDPKKVEFGRYKNDPHLIGDVVTEGKDAVKRLNYLVNEQENRYRLFEKAGVSNLQEYNAKGAEGKLPEGLPTHLPSIGLFIDEFGNLMGTHGKDIEGLVKQLGEKSRAAGVHLVLATQRPTAKNIPTDIRANIPTTIGLNARDWRESGYIGIEGLENLPQKGPLIIKSPDGKTTKVDGSFMNGDRISTLVKSSIANKKGPGAQENKGDEETQSIITPPKESATSEPTDNTGTKQRPGDSAKPQATSEKKEGSGLPSPAETQRKTERETVKESLREAYDIQHGAFDETINEAKKRYNEAIQRAKTNTQKKAALDEYTRTKDMALSQINEWRSSNGMSPIQDINADGSYQIEKIEDGTSAGEVQNPDNGTQGGKTGASPEGTGVNETNSRIAEELKQRIKPSEKYPLTVEENLTKDFPVGTIVERSDGHQYIRAEGTITDENGVSSPKWMEHNLHEGRPPRAAEQSHALFGTSRPDEGGSRIVSMPETSKGGTAEADSEGNANEERNSIDESLRDEYDAYHKDFEETVAKARKTLEQKKAQGKAKSTDYANAHAEEQAAIGTLNLWREQNGLPKVTGFDKNGKPVFEKPAETDEPTPEEASGAEAQGAEPAKEKTNTAEAPADTEPTGVEEPSPETPAEPEENPYLDSAELEGMSEGYDKDELQDNAAELHEAQKQYEQSKQGSAERRKARDNIRKILKRDNAIRARLGMNQRGDNGHIVKPAEQRSAAKTDEAKATAQAPAENPYLDKAEIDGVDDEFNKADLEDGARRLNNAMNQWREARKSDPDSDETQQAREAFSAALEKDNALRKELGLPERDKNGKLPQSQNTSAQEPEKKAEPAPAAPQEKKNPENPDGTEPPADDNPPDGGDDDNSPPDDGGGDDGGDDGGGSGGGGAGGSTGGGTTEPASTEPEKSVDKEESPTPKPEAPNEEEGGTNGKSSKKQPKAANPAENMQSSKKESAPERVESDTPADAFTRGTENLEEKTRQAMQSDPSIQALQAQVVKAKAEHGENSKEYKTASRMLESGQRRFTEAFRKSQEEDSGVKDVRTQKPSPQKPDHSTTAPTKEKAPEKQVPEKTKPTKEPPKDTREKASSSTKEKEPEKESKQESVKKPETKQEAPKKDASVKPEGTKPARAENKKSTEAKTQPKASKETQTATKESKTYSEGSPELQKAIADDQQVKEFREQAAEAEKLFGKDSEEYKNAQKDVEKAIKGAKENAVARLYQDAWEGTKGKPIHPLNREMAKNFIKAIEDKNATALKGALATYALKGKDGITFPDDAGSRKAFEMITGIKLPEPNKEAGDLKLADPEDPDTQGYIQRMKKWVDDFCGVKDGASTQKTPASTQAKQESTKKTQEKEAPKPAPEPEKKKESAPASTTSTETSGGETPQMKAYRERQEARAKAEKEAKEKTAQERARRFAEAQQSQQKGDRGLNKQSAEFLEEVRKEADTSQSNGFKALSSMKPLKKVDNATANDLNRQFEEISAEMQELSEKLKPENELSTKETRQTVGLLETLRKGLEDVVKDKKLGEGNFLFRHLRDSDGKVIGTKITKFRGADGKMKDVEEIKEEVKKEKAPSTKAPSAEATKSQTSNQEFGFASQIREKGKQKTSDLENRMKNVFRKKGKGADVQDEALPEGWYWDEEISDSPDIEDYIWHEIFDAAIVAMG